MTAPYAEGDVVRLTGESGKRYVVKRIKLNGEVDVAGERGLRTVTSDRVILVHEARPPVLSAPAPTRRAGTR